MENNTQQYQDIFELDSHGRKLSVFSKQKYYALTFAVFGLASLFFIALVNVFYQTDFSFTFFRAVGLIGSTAIVIAYIALLIMFNFFSHKLRPIPYILTTMVFMVATSFVFALLISLIFNTTNIGGNPGYIMLVLFVPAGLMLLAGLIGLNPRFQITQRWYYLLIFLSISTLSMLLLGWFLTSSILNTFILVGFSAVYFIIAIFDMQFVKKRAEHFNKYLGTKMTKMEIVSTAFESGFRLFYSYVMLVYYSAILFRR